MAAGCRWVPANGPNSRGPAPLPGGAWPRLGGGAGCNPQVAAGLAPSLGHRWQGPLPCRVACPRGGTGPGGHGAGGRPIWAAHCQQAGVAVVAQATRHPPLAKPRCAGCTPCAGVASANMPALLGSVLCPTPTPAKGHIAEPGGGQIVWPQIPQGGPAG